MSALKLLISADWHLDAPFEALSPALAREMRRDLREIPCRLADLARERGADMLLLPGDLFDAERPYLESARALADAFDGLDIPVFIAPGNHDFFATGSPWAGLRLPAGVHLFCKNELTCIHTEIADVYGAAFTEPRSRGLLQNFTAPRGGKPNILVLHADLGGGESYGPIAESELAKSGMDFAALGHIHRPSGLRRAGNTWWCYPGCPMGRGFDECGERGAALVTLSADGCEMEFIELAPRRYEVIQVPVTGLDAFAALSAAVAATRPGDICRFVLTGESDRPATARELKALADEHGLAAAFLRDRTTPPMAKEGGTLRNELLRLAEARLAGAETDTARAEIADALRWALAAIDNAEAPEEVRR
jgi:DNA repair exonuclease SbcCD nuclease subunit